MKRQGNIVAALMENFQIARKSLDTALNDSQGSAERELENWNQGIEASLAHLEASFQDFSQKALSSDLIKGFVDGGTAILDVITQITDKVGVAAPLIGGVLTKTGFGKRDAAPYKVKQKSPLY